MAVVVHRSVDRFDSLSLPWQELERLTVERVFCMLQKLNELNSPKSFIVVKHYISPNSAAIGSST